MRERSTLPRLIAVSASCADVTGGRISPARPQHGWAHRAEDRFGSDPELAYAA